MRACGSSPAHTMCGMGASRQRLMLPPRRGMRSDVPQQMAALARTLETVAPLILVLCAGGGYLLADGALRPIRTMARTAQQIGATDLSQRLNLQRRDELGELGATFDQMLDR